MSFIESMTPMLASTCEVELATLVGTHWFDQKLDGIRALISTEGGGFFMRNRRGIDLTPFWPELEAGASFALPHGVVLDGEVIAINGVFHDIARRDRNRNADRAMQLMVDVPGQFTAFDILAHPDHGDIRHWPYEKRRALLETLGLVGMHNYAMSVVSDEVEFYEKIKALGGEGIVAKRLGSKYGKGRGRDWLKYKTVRTVSAIVVGYEPGNGSRAECGAFLLAMVDEQARGQHVGKVGSGFTADSLQNLKSMLDQGVMPIVEIQTLGRTKEDKLRQPVYLGTRQDLFIHEVGINQLNALPRG